MTKSSPASSTNGRKDATAETTALEQRILKIVNRPDYQPVKPRVIAKRLGLPKDEVKTLRRLIKQMAKQGKVHWGASHLVRPASAQPHDRVTGVFQRKEGGFGFVRPSVKAGNEAFQQDIYIAPENAGDAASGDVVLVKLRKRRGRRGRPEGVILDVIQRETHRFVGTYFESAGLGMVQVDGGIFSQPIVVGDPGAKGARPNDKVVFEMVRFPTAYHGGEGVIVEVLGQRGEPGVDTLSIIHEFGLPDEFPEDVVQASREVAEQFDENDLSGRVDLTDTTVITIDPVDARDFDDAISLERLDNGHWLLGVHIADVAHFVTPGSPLDREAHDRATSVYLPDRVLPMLPEIISNSLASLQPDRVRYTKTAFLEFTPEGVRVDVKLHRAAIRSNRRFTYEEVDDYLAHRQKWKKRLDPDVHALLGRMHELAMILRRRRFQRGALELSMREVKVDLDENGQVCGAHVVENTESHQIIEEFMLAANEAVATTLVEAGFDILRRIHEPPDPRKLQALTEFVTELGFKVGNLQDRFELQRLLKEVHGKPEEHAVNYAVLRSLQRAVYSPVEEGHYALASDCYCHFTSPIRRYPDLTIHRAVDALLSGKRPALTFDDLVPLGEHCSQREQRAESAERELTKVKLLSYLSTRIGEEMDAIITGVVDFGLFAMGIDMPAEGLIHVESLTDDYYRYDRAAHTLTGYRSGNVYRLGDRVRVVVARVDLDRRELDFRIVEKAPTRGTATSRGTRGSTTATDSTRGRQRSRSATTGSSRRGAAKVRPASRTASEARAKGAKKTKGGDSDPAPSTSSTASSKRGKKKKTSSSSRSKRTSSTGAKKTKAKKTTKARKKASGTKKASKTRKAKSAQSTAKKAKQKKKKKRSTAKKSGRR